MPLDEASYIETNEKYKSGLALDFYEGNYSIASVFWSKAGAPALRWVYPQKTVDGKSVPGDKAVPMRIQIGDKVSAVKILEGLLKSVVGDSVYDDHGEDEVPF